MQVEWYTWIEIVVQACASVFAFYDYFRMLTKHKETRWYSLRAMILFCCGVLMFLGMLVSIFNSQIGDLPCLADAAIGGSYHTTLHTTVYMLVLYYFWQIYCFHAQKPMNKPYWLFVVFGSLGLEAYVLIGHYLSCKSPSEASGSGSGSGTGNGTVLYQSLIGAFYIFFLLLGLGLYYLVRVRLGNIILKKEHHFISDRFFSVILVYLPFFLGRIGTSIYALAKSSDTSPQGWGYALWVLLVDATPTIALIFSFRYYDEDLARVDEARYDINYETDEETTLIRSGVINMNPSV